MESSQRTGR
jgi:rhodanese-related sulfurtransferase